MVTLVLLVLVDAELRELWGAWSVDTVRWRAVACALCVSTRRSPRFQIEIHIHTCAYMLS